MKIPPLLVILIAVNMVVGCAATGPSPAEKPEVPAPVAAGPLDDANIAAHVEAALARDGRLRPYRIEAVVKEGVVTLFGDIKSLALRRRAAAIVLGIAGVRAVDNQLVITG